VKPLDGILAIDFSTLLPGPLATLMLANAGAEVIKIERPGGDDLRRWHPRWERNSVQYEMLNAGKKILVLDLNQTESRETIDPLLRRADVIVEQFRPGVMARLGLDYERVAAINPRVVYCSITGFGQDGPKSSIAGHDLNYIAESGLLSLSMGSSDHPVIPPALVADIAGGSYPAVINILLALKHRELTGRGCRLDVSMSDNLFTFMYAAIGSGSVDGTWPRNGEDTVTGGSPRYRLYPASDGRMVAVAALEDRFWTVFCDIIALEPSRRDDASNPAATAAAVARIIASEDAATWASRFAGKDCCCSIVRELPEALADPHFVHRGVTRDVLGSRDGRTMPALHVPIDRRFRGAV
jgi:crotonobetainyl-CoA:carnitine CoA-transferase CaiB-like acyl-CoA transferase